MELETIPTITQEQLAELHLLQSAPSVERFSQKHHILCRYLAKGWSPVHAAMYAGMSVSQANEIQRSPASQDLIDFYKQELEPFKEILMIKMQAISMESLDELLERFQDEALRQKIPISTLTKLIEMTADRLGMAVPKQAVEVNVNVGLASRLDAARKRVEEKVIDHIPNENESNVG